MEKLGIACKELMARELTKRLESSSHFFITSFFATDVASQDELRHQLKNNEAAVFVVKNSLAKRVLRQLKFEPLIPMMQGLIALALGNRDAARVSKTLMNFARSNENFKILGAYVDKQFLDATLVKELAVIPAKEVLLSQIVGGIKSPIQSLVNSLSGIARSFVIVLDKIREKKTAGNQEAV